MRRGGAGKRDSRRPSLTASEDVLLAISVSTMLGTCSGESNKGFGKPMDSAECERLNLRPLSMVVLGRRFGVLETWLNVFESEIAGVL